MLSVIFSLTSHTISRGRFRGGWIGWLVNPFLKRQKINKLKQMVNIIAEMKGNTLDNLYFVLLLVVVSQLLIRLQFLKLKHFGSMLH